MIHLNLFLFLGLMGLFAWGVENGHDGILAHLMIFFAGILFTLIIIDLDKVQERHK